MKVKRVGSVILVAFLVGLAWAEASDTSLWSIDDARIARKIEIQVDEAGNYREVEFHVDPAAVPAAVRDAMRKLHPGCVHKDAEIEREGDVTYYEITSEKDGLEYEAMFLPDGTLHAEENQIAASNVPETVRAAVTAAFPSGEVAKWEEIRDGKRTLVEYHVKLADKGRKVKAAVSTAGSVTRAVLEVPAEIEVPIPVPSR